MLLTGLSSTARGECHDIFLAIRHRCPRCNTNILVVECGTTDKREIAHAVSQLQRSGARLLGIVLNKVNGKQNRHGREGYYGHYGKYGRYGYKKYGDYGRKK